MTKLPLEGIKVLDFSRVLAGPWLTMSLADLGAEVWKIENVKGGDDTRAWSVPNYKGVSTYFLCANRGKQSIAVDLKAPEGKALVIELAKQADVVVENFRTGTMDRLGLGWKTMHELNPRLVYCSITGYGQSGPERTRPGYDFIMQAESGLMSITGEVDGPPNRLGTAFSDVVAGMVAAQSVLAALYQRRDTGKGQHIDVALLETTLNLLINVGTGYLNADVEATRYGNAHPTVVPYQLLRTSDGWLALAVGNDRMYRDFCIKVLDRPDLAEDARFVSSSARALNREALLEQIEAIVVRRGLAHWLEACAAADVPAGPVKSVSEALSAPSVIERGVTETLEHPELGPVRLIRAAHGLEAQRLHQAKAPPLLGEDTSAVLQQVLGLSSERIAELESAGVVRCHRPSEAGVPA